MCNMHITSDDKELDGLTHRGYVTLDAVNDGEDYITFAVDWETGKIVDWEKNKPSREELLKLGTKEEN